MRCVCCTQQRRQANWREHRAGRDAASGSDNGGCVVGNKGVAIEELFAEMKWIGLMLSEIDVMSSGPENKKD